MLGRADGQEAQRRQVVVLFADVVGFTSLSEQLDPEALRIVMDRYFRVLSRIIWDRGGATEKFIGDAVMAVFGMTQVSEDDALRAVQAALDIIAALGGLNVKLRQDFKLDLTVRIGVHSGPVSATYDRGGDFRVVGDTVNTASRLQAAAQPNSVLVGEAVAAALRGRACLSDVPPLTLKGKEAPVRAWAVESLSVPDELAAQPAPLIGREVELAQLRQVYARSVSAGRGALVSVCGPPGIGKTRLLEAFLAALDEPRPIVLRARARSFNRGVSYLPIMEMLAAVPGERVRFARSAEADPAAARAVACLDRLAQHRSGPPHGDEIQEVAWALRTFLSALAAHGPLVLVWEDLQWAEPVLLDVVEYLADELAALPMLQLCTARPELADLRPDWLRGGTRTLTVELAPLSPAETELLVAHLATGGAVVAHSVDEVCMWAASASEGNPLFAELLLATQDNPDEPLPHTITAVFAARLDRLHPSDRRVLEMAAVVGRAFASADIDYLLAVDNHPPLDLDECLERLRRSRLLSGNRLSARHSFAQAFLRDTTYELSGKASRLRWHLALANRGMAVDGSRTDEAADGASLLTYHLEAAAVFSRQLHPGSASTDDNCRCAADQLARQAADATHRQDLRAAAGLLERALAVLPSDAAQRIRLALWLSDTRLELGDFDAASVALHDWASDGSHPSAALSSLVIPIQREIIRVRGASTSLNQVLAAERHFEPRLRSDDHLAWCRFHQLRSHRHIINEQVGAAEDSLAAARRHAQALEDAREIDRIDRTAVELALWGPTPVADGLTRCRDLTATFQDSRVCLVPVLGATAGLLGLDGRFKEAVATLELAVTYASELRMHSADVALAYLRGLIDSVAGAHESAENSFRRAQHILASASQPDGEALMDAYAAREIVARGAEPPERYVKMDDAAVADIADPRRAALTSVLCAHAAATADERSRVLDLAARAATCADRMDDLYFRGTIHRDVAALRQRVADPDGARQAATTARECFLAKGARAAIPGVDRTLALVSSPSVVEEGR
jgi:class 3 adenylate cyclase/tetratricopeptide (TPR) repeat protein